MAGCAIFSAGRAFYKYACSTPSRRCRMRDADYLEDAVEQLKSQREHVANTTRVLEAIICHCSSIVRGASDIAVREVATRWRDTAITAYATSASNGGAIGELLEETIAGLERQLGLHAPP